MFTREQKKIIALSSLGGALEFYDFIIFVFLAKVLGELFFPSVDPAASLMATFAVFAVGYLARPIGGMLFGHFGDTFGRKKTFVATVILMAIPTFLIGVLPTYHSIGLWASSLLIVLRILQGLSLGGEIPGALVFIAETVVKERRGLAIGLILIGINSGMLLGSLLGAWVTHLDNQHLMTWGWRIPFCLGGLLGVVSYILRKRMQETELFMTLLAEQKHVQIPFKEILLRYPLKVIQGIFVVSLGATMVSVFYLFMPTYLSIYFHYPLSKLLTLNTINILIFSLPVLLMGHLSDRYGRKIIIYVGLAFFIVATYPLFLLFKDNNFNLVIMVTMICSLFASCVTGVFPCLLTELYPTKIRYSGTAICYGVGFGVVGGLIPLLVTVLIRTTHDVLIPASFLSVIAFVALIALFFMRETHAQVLDH